jgi:3-oxoacyl-[acyl-carrier-protein] synthase II
MSEVMVTGMGLVCALGSSVEASVDRAWRGEAGFRRCDEALWGEAGRNLRCRVAAMADGVEVDRWLPARLGRWRDRGTAYALAAVAEALEDAGPAGWDKRRVGVIIGQAAPGQALSHAVMQRALVEGAPETLPGRVLPQLSGNIAGALTALQYGFQGLSYGVVDACATGATAIALGADAIRAGRADVVIAGAADAPVGLQIFGSMLSAGAMNPTDDPTRACRPFSADRAGLVVGEGAAVVVLESAAHAAARGARVQARLLGEAMSNDAHHLYSPEPTGESWAAVMRRALERAGVAPEDVDMVSAHAASTPTGDAIEVAALRRALGARAEQIPVFSTKSMHGHCFGAAGAIETVLALAAMRRGRVLPTAHLDRPDPTCDLDHVPDPLREGRGRVLLKDAFGFGGTNTTLVLSVEPAYGAGGV